MTYTSNYITETTEEDINFDLGYYIGLYLLKRIPTLNIFNYKTPIVIEVDNDDKLEYDRLDAELFCEKESYETRHAEYVKFYKGLEKQYLPAKIEGYVPSLKYTNLKYFLLGVEFALWDSDICSYVVDTDEVPLNEDGYGAHINLYLHQIPNQ